MPGFSISLPIYTDDVDGFLLNKTYLQVAQQNLKCLLLTNPGEKLMYPNFGCGIKHVLFEQMHENNFANLITIIIRQTKEWLPYINILDVATLQPGTPHSEAKGIDHINKIGIVIRFEVLNIGEQDQITLYFDL